MQGQSVSNRREIERGGGREKREKGDLMCENYSFIVRYSVILPNKLEQCRDVV